MFNLVHLFGGAKAAPPRNAAQLAIAIENARRTAIAHGVHPIPSPIDRALLGFFPSALLRQARFAIGPTVTLPHGDALAVTAGDVILFRTERLALTDAGLWARELTRVVQYQRWGLDGFCQRCFQQGSALEREADDNAARFAAWSRRAA